MTRQTASSGNLGIGGVAAVVATTLKLVGVITWSWWWVLAPLWAPLLLAAIMLAAAHALTRPRRSTRR